MLTARSREERNMPVVVVVEVEVVVVKSVFYTEEE
jgi:hypothetical protein